MDSDMMGEPLDVVIAGAGLAGGTLALRLARAGARVTVVDPARFPRDKLCGEYLSPECWGVLDRLGLAPAVDRLGYHPIHRVRVTTPRGRALVAEVTGRDGRPGIGLSRSALDDLIVRSAQAEGVTVLEATRVVAPLVRDGRVVGVVARQGAGAAFELPARVTVAADGRHSSLVARTGRTRPRSRFRPRSFGLKQHLEVDPEDSSMEPPGTVGLHLVPGGYVGACRVEAGRANLCGLLPESTLKRHRGDLDALARDVLSRNPVLAPLWERARPAGGWKTVAGVRVETSRPTLPGILYAGDCQGTIDPLGGQGMTMALLGAEMLAPVVLGALVDRRRGADASVQAACQAAWRRRFDRRVNLCRIYHHFLVNPAVVDVASGFESVAGRLLTVFFDATRDPKPEPG